MEQNGQVFQMWQGFTKGSFSRVFWIFMLKCLYNSETITAIPINLEPWYDYFCYVYTRKEAEPCPFLVWAGRARQLCVQKSLFYASLCVYSYCNWDTYTLLHVPLRYRWFSPLPCLLLTSILPSLPTHPSPLLSPSTTFNHLFTNHQLPQ